MELLHSPQTITFKGQSVTFEAEFYRCTSCGTEIEEPGQLDRNLDAAREVYDRLFATPSPAELVSLREHYGASQKAFGMLLGFGEATMNTYEQGKIPDPVNRLLLKLARNPFIFKEIYDINKQRIGLLQRDRIEASAGYREACTYMTHPVADNGKVQLKKGKLA
jgi:putative zinc finger/helix-turn-helix YgiT family protein